MCGLKSGTTGSLSTLQHVCLCAVYKQTYTYTHIHVTAKAVPRKKPAAKEEDDDLRELAAWAS